MLVDTLNDIDPKYPVVEKEKEKLIDSCREYLNNEGKKISEKE